MSAKTCQRVESLWAGRKTGHHCARHHALWPSLYREVDSIELWQGGDIEYCNIFSTPWLWIMEAKL